MKKISLVLVIILFACKSGFTQVEKSYWQVSNAFNPPFLLTIEMQDGEFKAYTRKNAMKQIIKQPNYFIGRLTGKIKQSEIVQLKGNYSIIADTIKLTGKYSSIYSEQKVYLVLVNSNLFGYHTPNDTIKHNLVGTKIDSDKPLHDYAAIIDSAFILTNKHIYNPKLLKTKEWIRFEKHINSYKHKIADNWELQVGFWYPAAKLPFSHYALSETKKTTRKETKNLDLKQLNNTTYLLTVKSFAGSKTEMDSVLNILKQKEYDNFIIDLRNNRGGSVEAAMPLAQYLIPDTTLAGIF